MSKQTYKLISIILALSLLLPFGIVSAQDDAASTAAECAAGKPRVVLFADPELDDQNTLIRYLLYADGFQTEGLMYQAARVHWKGDGEGTPYTGTVSEHLNFGIEGDVTTWRWNEDEQFIHDAVEIYAEVYENLTAHAEGYPTPDELRAVIYEGNIEFPGDISEDTPGSDRVKELLLDENPCPVWLASGAGLSTIARALLSIAEEYEGTDQWDEIYASVSEKAILTVFGDQDNAYANYILPNWPNIQYLRMNAGVWGYGARNAVLPIDREYLSAAWTREYVSEVGPLGAYYRVWGDGVQMVEGDITDYFGFVNLNAQQLLELGYVTWTAPQEAGSWISEGDTPMYLNLINNGLDSHLDPTYGGWGGRLGDDINPTTNVVETSYDASRFFGAAQRDFAARLRWSITPDYADANHAPVITVTSPESLTVRPGETVVLTATAIDPDGDHIVGSWWQYHEVDTYPGKVLPTVTAPSWRDSAPFTVPALVVPGDDVSSVISSEIEVTTQFNVPTDAIDGQTLHFIIEVKDNADPSLTGYVRVVLTIQR